MTDNKQIRNENATDNSNPTDSNPTDTSCDEVGHITSKPKGSKIQPLHKK
jgi:hypothetical protein